MGIYEDLGVTTVINGQATVTILGGSRIPPEVTSAMAEAAQSFVSIDELQEKAGGRIAEWTGNEAAYISCGAAAGLVLSTASCITGLDPEKRARLPTSHGMKNEIVLHTKGRVSYDFAIRQAGGVPVIVDAAAQIPPVENLWRFTGMGADIALFSGGKGLCGPQASGLVVGRKQLIEACAFNACPRPFIGRPMKAGKEEIVGLMTAVRRYLDLDHEALMQCYEACVAFLVNGLAESPFLTAVRDFPNEAGQPMSRTRVTVDEAGLGVSRDELLDALRHGRPAIALARAGTDGVYINPQTIGPGEEEIILRRLLEEASPRA